MMKIGFLIFTLVICQGFAVPDDDWEDFWDYNEVDSDTNSTIEGTELEDMIPELNATTDSPTLPEDLKVVSYPSKNLVSNQLSFILSSL